MFDSHIHLDQYENIEQQIELWQRAGITGVVAVSTNLASSYKTLTLKQRFPTFVKAAIGFHPEQSLPSEQEFLEWERLVSKERKLLSAIGEVGLPYYTKVNSLDPYIELLNEVIKMAKHGELPLALHAIHNQADIVFNMLKKHSIKKVHFHWLKASDETLDKIVKEGYLVSVTPEVCYRERDQLLAMKIPTDQLLLETDGPWPFNGPFEGNVTSPLLLKDIAHTIAKIKSIPIEQIVEISEKNTIKLYK